MERSRCAVSTGADDMTILAFLQCQWFKDPDRARRLLARYCDDEERGRNRFLRDMLFLGCLTGKRLQAVFGEMCSKITWEEASDNIAGKSSGVFPADPQHMAQAI